MAWLDLGTPPSLLTASQFVQTLEQRTGLKIACVEEIALTRGFIDLADFESLMRQAGTSDYGRYLQRVYLEQRDSLGNAIVEQRAA
jgi:glucose-1-phosphate thymidylyltransferase